MCIRSSPDACKWNMELFEERQNIASYAKHKVFEQNLNFYNLYVYRADILISRVIRHILRSHNARSILFPETVADGRLKVLFVALL